MNDELKTKLKRVVVAYEVLSRYLLGGTGGNHENLRNDSRPPGRDLNLDLRRNDSHS
jgi:hypothetical protein